MTMTCLMVLLVVMGACFLWKYAFIFHEEVRCRNNYRSGVPISFKKSCSVGWPQTMAITAT